METTKVTMNINSDTYNKFKQYCKSKGLVVSRTIELYMEEKLSNKNV